MSLRTAVLACLLVAACGKGPTTEEKIAALESIKREAMADVVRQEGECRAVAVEFKNDALMNASCAETLRMVATLSAQIAANVDRRIAEIHAGR